MATPPFRVEGARWEPYSYEGRGITAYSLHVEIGTGKHVCLWCYEHKEQLCLATYHAGRYVDRKNEIWLDPLEALCAINEAIKERDEWLAANTPPKPSSTTSRLGPTGKGSTAR